MARTPAARPERQRAAPMQMIAASSPAASCRRFVVAPTPDGRWSAADKHGVILRVFATRREAIHFALFEAGTRRAAVLLAPND